MPNTSISKTSHSLQQPFCPFIRVLIELAIIIGMDRIILFQYNNPETGFIQLIESQLISEDSKFLYVAAGKFFKKFVTVMSSKVLEEDGNGDD
jgi:hypothetical protein